MTRSRFHLSLLMALALTACASSGPVEYVPDVTEMDARTAFVEGDFRRSADLYLDLANARPGQRNRFRLLAAEALRQEGDLAAMAQVAESIQRDRLRDDLMLRLDLLLAEAELLRNNPDGALALLAIPDELHTRTTRMRAYELRARAYAAQGKRLAAANERLQLEPLLESEERALNRSEAQEALAELSDEELRQLIRDTPRDEPLYALLATLGRERFQGERQGSFARAVQAAPSRSTENLRTFDTEQLPRDATRQVALLLPLSGPLANPASALRDGVMSAYFADRGERPQLLVYDAGTRTDETLAAYDRAVAEGADRILGPLSREAVTALFQSNRQIVPTLALNYADAPALSPSGSLQFALLPEEEAAAIAVRLAEKQQRRVLVIHSNDEFGERAFAAFSAAHEARGGKISGKASYAGDRADQSALLGKLAGSDSGRDRLRYLRGLLGLDLKYEPAPRADLDAIVLLLRAPQARLIMPQLRTRADLPSDYYATSAVYSGRPDSALDRDLDGLQFCDSPWMLDSWLPGSIPTRIEAAGLATSEGPATRLFAFGIDAWRLLPVMEWVESHPGEAIDGATGKLLSDRSGRVRRVMAWARFENGVPVAAP